MTLDMMDLIDRKITEGFAGVHARLDLLNGQVRRHGEDIAVLKRDSEKLAYLESQIRDTLMDQAVCASVCPWRQEGTMEQRRKRDLAIGVSSSAVTFVLLELLPKLVELFRRLMG